MQSIYAVHIDQTCKTLQWRGQGRWPKYVGVLCSKYKNIVQLVGSESWVIFSYLRKDFYTIPTSVTETSWSFASSDVLKILNHFMFYFFYNKYTRLRKNVHEDIQFACHVPLSESCKIVFQLQHFKTSSVPRIFLYGGVVHLTNSVHPLKKFGLTEF
jgi:hypothetical protein